MFASLSRRERVRALGSAAAALLVPVAAEACAVCLGPPSGGDPGPGLNGSFLFLLLMPFAVVASLGGWLFLAHRRARVRRGAASFDPAGWTVEEGGK